MPTMITLDLALLSCMQLDLSRNELRAEGATALALVLKVMPSLTEVR